MLAPVKLGGTWTATHQPTAKELGVLRVPASFAGAWLGRDLRHEHECPLAQTRTAACRDHRLRGALVQLRRQRLLAFTLEGDVARVTYGDRVREIATEWGLVLPPAS